MKTKCQSLSKKFRIRELYYQNTSIKRNKKGRVIERNSIGKTRYMQIRICSISDFILIVFNLFKMFWKSLFYNDIQQFIFLWFRFKWRIENQSKMEYKLNLPSRKAKVNFIYRCYSNRVSQMGNMTQREHVFGLWTVRC